MNPVDVVFCSFVVGVVVFVSSSPNPRYCLMFLLPKYIVPGLSRCMSPLTSRANALSVLPPPTAGFPMSLSSFPINTLVPLSELSPA